MPYPWQPMEREFLVGLVVCVFAGLAFELVIGWLDSKDEEVERAVRIDRFRRKP